MLLITGASGFIGSALLRRLARNGREIIAAWRTAPPAPLYAPRGQCITPVRLDVTRPSDFEALRWADVSAVIHLAAAIPGQTGKLAQGTVPGEAEKIDRREGTFFANETASRLANGGDCPRSPLGRSAQWTVPEARRRTVPVPIYPPHGGLARGSDAEVAQGTVPSGASEASGACGLSPKPVVERGLSAPRCLLDNAFGTANVVEFCRSKKIKTLVLASSVAVYGKSGALAEDEKPAPRDDYGFSKLAAEKICEKFARRNPDARCVVLRLSAVYGCGMTAASVLPVFVEKALGGEDLTVFGDGAGKMDYIHVDDAACAFEAALESAASGAFNICSGEAVSVRELASRVVAALGSPSRVVNDFAMLCHARETRPSPEKAARMLGFKAAVNLDEGLARFKEHRSEASITQGEGICR